jgi:hypothetical protein
MQVPWNQTSIPSKAAMLKDATRMLALRRVESDVIHANKCTANVLPTKIHSFEHVGVTDTSAPPAAPWVPYVRYINGTKAILIAGNHQNSTKLTLTISVPLAAMGMDARAQFVLDDLWSGSPQRTVSGSDLAAFALTVPADQAAGGGLAVLKITPKASLV